MSRTVITETQMPQRSEAWHEWRSSLITASQAAIIAGDPPPKRSWKVDGETFHNPQTWRELRSFVDNQPINDAMQHGIDNESKALAAFNDQINGPKLEPVCVEYITKSGVKLGASLDGYREDGDTHSMWVEIKCPPQGRQSKLWASVEAGDIPEYYLWQLVHQYLCIGQRNVRGYFVIYEATDGALIMSLDNEMLHRKANELAPLLRAYHNGESQRGDLADDETFGKLERRWAKANAKRKEIANIEKECRDKLEAFVKEAGLDEARGQHTHIYKSSRTSTQWAAFKADHPELSTEIAKYERQTSFYTVAGS